jgi:capsular polysaccharide biosynthesis protein
MPDIIDYKTEVKRLIQENYEPADMLTKEVEKTTKDLVEGFSNIMSSKQVDEHVVYEALIELGYTPKEKEPLSFSWFFKRK